MADLTAIVGRFPACQLAVAGDVMLDHFIVGRVDRISPEAPVPVVCFEREEFRLGGAANVANNLRALGAGVALTGLIGNDDSAQLLRTQLGEACIDTRNLVVDEGRPTTRKTRVVTTRNQQVARVDREDDREAADGALSGLVSAIRSAAADAGAIVLSDYRKGVVCPATIDAAVGAARERGIPLLVDPKVAVADRYRGASLITPNHHEAELMTQRAIRSSADARDAARHLHERTGASVIITRGEHGMWVLDASRSPFEEAALPALTREVADVTGAGDTVIAVLGLALAAGATLVDAARLANLAAGLVVSRFGSATVTPAELVGAATAFVA